MQFITEWVRNIVVFLLIATIMNMLLPNSNLQKYVKFVVSLLLVVLILTPLFTLLKTDVPTTIESLFNQKSTVDSKVENTIDAKKKEIQASQRAYILEQMAVQMKNEVEKNLETKYGMQVVNLDIAVAKDKQEVKSQQDIETVSVTVTKADRISPSAITAIKKVDIQANEKELPENIQVSSKIQQFLAQEWQMDEGKIKVSEGRAGNTNE